MSLEPTVFPRARIAATLRALGMSQIGHALAAFIFAASGPVAIILSVGGGGGLSEPQLASWIFGAFFLNGFVSLYFCWAYRQPLVFFWTIPGTVLVGAALDHVTFAEVLGAYFVTALLMFVLGVTGWVNRLMSLIPMPIVMAMVAGVFLRFGVDWVNAFSDGWAIAVPMTIAFLAASAVPGVARHLPPLVIALLVGVIVILWQGEMSFSLGDTGILAAPMIQTPAFSWQAMVELVIPLAITVLVVQNGQGMAVLRASGHQPPMNAVAVGCAVGSAMAALVGTVSTCLTGPTNAIVAAEPPRERHYAAAMLVALLGMLFGLFAPLFTRLMLVSPDAFIATLAGCAMLKVLQTAFVTAFSARHTLGALATFVITVSDLAIFSIGAAFWGLVFGYLISRLLERDDFSR